MVEDKLDSETGKILAMVQDKFENDWMPGYAKKHLILKHRFLDMRRGLRQGMGLVLSGIGLTLLA